MGRHQCSVIRTLGIFKSYDKDLEQKLNFLDNIKTLNDVFKKTLDNWFLFYLSEPPVLAEAAGSESYFAPTQILQNRHFHMWRDVLTKCSSLKYSQFILAFQLQFGTYEAESEHFWWENEKRHFNEWFSR